MVKIFVLSFVALLISMGAQAQIRQAPRFVLSGCNQQVDPHSYACHEAAFDGQTEFPVVPLNSWGSLQGEWFAVTYAIPSGNKGAGFVMDKNPFRPSRPGKGVFNLFQNGSVSLLGSLFINGDRAIFVNWQNAQMSSVPGSMGSPDLHTVAFQTDDHFGIRHEFQCRDFIRNGAHHLTCRWWVLRPNGAWDLVGYFGFLTRQMWDQFMMRSGRQ